MSYFLFVVLMLFSFKSYADFSHDCSDELFYDYYLKYREEINQSTDPVKTLHFFDQESFRKTAQVGLQENFFSRLLISDKKITKKMHADMKRYNSVEREIVGIKSYYGLCNGARGELYMQAVNAGAYYTNSAILLKKEEGRWVQDISEILENDLSIFKGSMNETYKVLVNDDVFKCLSQLEGFELRYDNIKKYNQIVQYCYEQPSKS